MKTAPGRADLTEDVDLDLSVLPKGTRAFLGYTRRSKGTLDADFVERHERLMMTMAARANGVIVRWYRESVSGYNAKAVRHAFNLLLDDAEQADGIAMAFPDRLARNDYDIGRLIRFYELHPAKVLVIGDPDEPESEDPMPFDMSSASGRDRLVDACRAAKRESRQQARRVRNWHAQRQRQGKVHSVMRPFGLNDDKQTLRMSEVMPIRNAAVALLATEADHRNTLAGIVRQWNADGLRTSVGNEWTVTRLRELLQSPRMVGYRVKMVTPEGQTRPVKTIMRDDAKKPVIAHEEILDHDTWSALCALFESRTRPGHAHKAQFELSGLLRCAECKAVMIGNRRPPKANGDPRWIFSCPAPAAGGCGKTTISGHDLTRLVVKLVLEYLASLPATVAVDPGPFDDGGRADQLRERRENVVKRNLAGQLSDESADEYLSQIDKESRQLRRERDAWTRARAKVQNATPTPWVERYGAADVAGKRALLSELIRRIDIRSNGGTAGPRFDESRVSIGDVVWR